jgi:hypothetical protein
MLVVLAQAVVELSPIGVGDREFCSGLGVRHDAVPELLDKRQTRLHVEREKFFETRGRHDSTVP